MKNRVKKKIQVVRKQVEVYKIYYLTQSIDLIKARNQILQYIEEQNNRRIKGTLANKEKYYK